MFEINKLKGSSTSGSNRNEEEVVQVLNRLTFIGKKGGGNLLEVAIEAAKKRASLGEISFALEKAFSRYTANTQTIHGVYSNQAKMNDTFEKALMKADEFARKAGRRPRILICKLGQDGHDRGAKVIATSFADIGFDVDIGPLFQTPGEAAMQAAENDVHILGVSSLAGGHKTLIPQTIKALKNINRPDILVVAGGVIPTRDYEYLKACGVTAIFGPGTVISEAAIEILEKMTAI